MSGVTSTYKYNPHWSKLLNLLLDKGTLTCINRHCAVFKLIIETKEKFLFWEYVRKKEHVYEVWIANESSSYGFLWAINGAYTGGRHSPGWEALQKLKQTVDCFNDGLNSYHYKIPKGVL